MHQKRSFIAIGALALLLASGLAGVLYATHSPTITLTGPTAGEVYGFNAAVDVGGNLIWNPVHDGEATYTVTMTLLCPRDLRVVSEDTYVVDVGDGEESVPYFGELLTPDGSDPDDEGPFCVVVECAGSREEVSITVQGP